MNLTSTQERDSLRLPECTVFGGCNHMNPKRGIVLARMSEKAGVGV